MKRFGNKLQRWQLWDHVSQMNITMMDGWMDGWYSTNQVILFVHLFSFYSIILTTCLCICHGGDGDREGNPRERGGRGGGVQIRSLTPHCMSLLYLHDIWLMIWHTRDTPPLSHSLTLTALHCNGMEYKGMGATRGPSNPTNKNTHNPRHTMEGGEWPQHNILY